MNGMEASGAQNHDECVVLKSMQYKESDRIVTVFSRAFGRHNLLARGACKPNSKLSGFTDSLSILQYIPKKTRTFTLLTEPRIVAPLFNIKQAGRSFFHACAICELALRGSEFDSPMPAVYDALKDSLVIIDLVEAEDELKSLKAVLKFKLFFLEQTGFPVNLEHCSACGKTMGEEFSYDTDAGASLCRRCSIGKPRVYDMKAIAPLIGFIAGTADMKEILASQYSKYEILNAMTVVRHHVRANLHIALASESLDRV